MPESLPPSLAPSLAPRALPVHPNLDHLRGQARALLDGLRAADPAALERIARAVPHAQSPWQLADAQFALAREHGFASWPKLAAHVEAFVALAPRERAKRAFVAALHAGDADALATLFRDEPSSRELVNEPIDPFGARPIVRVKSNLPVLDLLLANGADINLRSDWWAGPWGVLDGATPAAAEALIARGATIDIFAAMHLDRLDVARALLDADPSLVHAHGGDGGRPLHFASSAEGIELLLSRGAEIDARDVDHLSTALQWQMPKPDQADRAARLAIVRLLAERGATIDVFAAAALDDVAMLGRALDAHPQAIGARVNTPGYPPCPVREGGHMYSYKFGSGCTPHEVAAAFGSSAVLTMLMERSSPVQRLIIAIAGGRAADARSIVARDPSLLAKMTPEDHGALPTAAWREDEAATLLMLDLGFDPLARGPDGGTALHAAAWRGLTTLVERILAHPRVTPILGTLIAFTDTAHGSTPLGWCCHGSKHCHNPAGDYPRIARALVAAGAVPGPNLDDATPEVRKALAR